MLLRAMMTATILVSLLRPGTGDDVRCAYARRAVCGPKGCSQIPPADNYLLLPTIASLRAAADAERPAQVRRCDSKGCTPVDVVVVQAGDYFLNLIGPTSSFMMRIAVEDEPLTGLKSGEFAETAYLLQTAYLGFGRCPR